MKPLPYFRWYPADAETDSMYASLNDAELGFYHRCLNRSWLNGGIPSDLNKLAVAFRRSRKSLDRVWPKLCMRWIPNPADPSMLVNPRQEREREYAKTKSERNTDAVRTRYERSTNVVQHARARADSDSVFDSVYEVLEEQKETSGLDRDDGAFHRWWNLWCAGTHRAVGESDACQAWISVVTKESTAAVFECLESYLSSAEVQDGKIRNASKFLFEEHRNMWKSRWPCKVLQSRSLSATEQAKKLWSERNGS